MNKNFKLIKSEYAVEADKNVMDRLSGDTVVEMPFGKLNEGITSYLALIDATVSLIALIREEDALKKHHRAYLHVREELSSCADKTAEQIEDILTGLTEQEHILRVKTDSVPFAEAEEAEDEDDEEKTVTIPKEKYESMVDDLLTMAELIAMVSDLRTKDLSFIKEMAKFMPSYAAYEDSRVSLYREAAKEAEAIMDRWEEELDEDYEPDEYFSD